MTSSNERTLLAVLAHPDDESFGTGGTLALYATRGVQVHLLCATRGEVGTVAPEMLEGHASVGDLRQSELECAAGHLGLAGVHFLGYRDSGMQGSPDNRHPQALVAASLDKVAADIVTWIRRLRPQVVITFDPIGGYHHPDHIACHNATRLAFEAAGDPARYPDVNYMDAMLLIAWLTGPGYFVVHEDPPRGVAIDYREVPPGKPGTWPEVKPNDRGFSRFVYRDMVDYMRRVSRDVFIGAAHRHGRELGNYFVLCRGR